MIEKISRNSAILTKNEDVLLEIYNKINELVVAVNDMKQYLDWDEAQKIFDTDPYAKARKWAGKLCWFWEDDPNDKIVDVLSHIDTTRVCPFVQCDHQVSWTNCEPVKPTDDIIFKD